MKKIYEVRFPVYLEIAKRVKAHDEEEAKELALRLFSGLTFRGRNGDQVTVDGEGEEMIDYYNECNVNDVYDCFEADKDSDYDPDTEDEEDEEDFDEEEEEEV